MKKIFLLAIIAIAVFSGRSVAQSGYKTAVGLGIDFGEGATLVGPSIKHFITSKDALQGEVLFGNDATWLGGYYQYNQSFNKASELKWYIGVGPQVALYDGGSSFFIRPMAGLDYKIREVPLSLNFDWRPAIGLDDGSDFEPGRFGLGFRFTF
jgi:hypothetical protein